MNIQEELKQTGFEVRSQIEGEVTPLPDGRFIFNGQIVDLNTLPVDSQLPNIFWVHQAALLGDASPKTQ